MIDSQVGLHISSAGSLDLAFDRALEVGATTFQVFTRNPNQWKFNPIPDEVIAAFLVKRKASGFKHVAAHMPYLPNLASSERGIMKASRTSLDEEVRRCDVLGIDYLVIHLGSHMGKGTMVGVNNISEAVNEALAGSSGATTILLENMAGQKNCVGARFEELALILDRVRKNERAAVCFDTCMPPDSLVLLDGTPGRIQDVLPGESVTDSNGVSSSVTRVMKRSYDGDIVWIRPAGLPWIRVTPEHPMLYVTVNRIKRFEEKPWRVKMTDSPAWVEAGEVKEGNYLVIPKLVGRGNLTVDFRPYFGGDARRPFPLEIAMSDELAELFGLYLAEGFASPGKGLGIRGGDNGKVCLSFGKHEQQLVNRAVYLFETLFGLSAWIDEAKTAIKVCVGSNVLSSFFRANFGSSAREKRIPSLILFSEEPTIRAFVLAYLAGDGCVGDNGIRFATSSITVAHQLVLLLERIDIRATISHHNPTEGRIGDRPIHGSGWYTVSVGRADSRKLGFEYELPTASQRTVLRTPSSFLVPIASIQREYYKGDVFNLSTGTGSFLAPLVATHNCHAYAAGFDLASKEAVERTMALFDQCVGYDRLKVVHLNDSKGALGSNLDRHELVGKGKIGVQGMKAILHYKAMTERPLIMETPLANTRAMKLSLAKVRRLMD